MISTTGDDFVVTFTKEFVEDLVAYAGDGKLKGRFDVDGKHHEFEASCSDGIYKVVIKKEANK